MTLFFIGWLLVTAMICTVLKVKDMDVEDISIMSLRRLLLLIVTLPLAVCIFIASLLEGLCVGFREFVDATKDIRWKRIWCNP